MPSEPPLHKDKETLKQTPRRKLEHHDSEMMTEYEITMDTESEGWQVNDVWDATIMSKQSISQSATGNCAIWASHGPFVCGLQCENGRLPSISECSTH